MTELSAALDRFDRRFADIDRRFGEVNSRIDRLFLAMLTIGAGVGAAQIGLLVTLILRT